MSFRRRPPDDNVRRAISNKGNIRGVVTNKAGRTVQFESFAERCALLSFERDKEIVDYSSQPEEIRYYDPNGTARTYVPDFIVWRGDGAVEMHSVVYSASPEGSSRPYEAAVRRVCSARGWSYVLHSHDMLPRGTELANLECLEAFRPMAFRNIAVALAIFERLHIFGSTNLRTLITDIMQVDGADSVCVVETVCNLIWHGEIQTDFNSLLFVDGRPSPAATVWL